MPLTILGSSPAFPNPGKASSGYLVSSGETRVLVDCGHGVAASLRTVLEPWNLTAVAISHMDPDHFFDLVPLRYVLQYLGPPNFRLPLFLPPNGHELLDNLSAVLGIGDRLFSCFDIHEYEPDRSLLIGELNVEFAATRHYIPGWGMRFSVPTESGVLAYTSDTAPSEPIVDLLANADLALVEATVREYREPHEAAGHSTARLAGEMAAQAGVRRLLITHYEESLGPALVADASAVFAGHVELARAGATYEV